MIVLIMKMKLAERLKHTREVNKISMRKLAEDVGVSVSNISFYESGKSVPSAEVVFNIAKYFNITSDYLLGLSDEPHGSFPSGLEEKLERTSTLESENSILYEKIDQIQKLLDGINKDRI